MLAIISDIHSNVEALTAVLADVAGRGAQRIICLGDIVGYGPQPAECVDILMAKADVTLMGNHDYAVLLEPNKFNISAETACYWTRQQFVPEPIVVRKRGSAVPTGLAIGAATFSQGCRAPPERPGPLSAVPTGLGLPAGKGWSLISVIGS